MPPQRCTQAYFCAIELVQPPKILSPNFLEQDLQKDFSPGREVQFNPI